MLVVAAVLPHPPALVPDVASGAAHELDSLRLACTAALEHVRSVEPDLVVVVGAGSQLATFPPGSAGSLAGFGVPVMAAFPGAPAQPEATLPLALTVGAALMAGLDLMAGFDGWPTVRAESVPQSLLPSDAAAMGRDWAAAADRVAIIAMGDGSAALTVKAPGYLVEGAPLWQKRMTQALVDVDLDALLAVDAEEASGFAVAGRPVWQVLAGAARGARGATTEDGHWRGDLLADTAPYGVAYLVATWTWESA